MSTFDAALQQQVADLQAKLEEAQHVAAASMHEAMESAWQLSRLTIAAERLVKEPFSPKAVKFVKTLLQQPPSAALQKLVELREERDQLKDRCEHAENEVRELKAQLAKEGA